jgi:hypothetical protein
MEAGKVGKKAMAQSARFAMAQSDHLKRSPKTQFIKGRSL